MTAFIARQVLSEYKSIGDQLRFTRLQKGFSLEEVSGRLKVRLEYLRALEDEDYVLLPGGIYGKIFLKKYVRTAKLQTQPFMFLTIPPSKSSPKPKKNN